MRASRQSILEHVGSAPATRIIRTGSMRPTIRSGDSIRFRRSQSAPGLGEVWVVEGPQQFFVHRILWERRNAYLLKGDFNLLPDGWFPRSALFGPISEIRHAGRWRPANGRRDRLAGLALSGLGTTWQASRLVARRLARAVLGEPRARALAATLFGR